MNISGKNQLRSRMKAISLLLAVPISLAGCGRSLPFSAPSGSESDSPSGNPAKPGLFSLPGNTPSPDSSHQQNFWHLVTEGSGTAESAEPAESTESAVEKEPDSQSGYESAWFKLNEAGNTAETGMTSAVTENVSSVSSVSSGSSVSESETDTMSFSGSSLSAVPEENGTSSSDSAIPDYTDASFPLSQEEFEEALAAAYADGYKEGYSAGTGMDDSRLQITYLGDGLSAETSTLFLSQGLPLLRTPDAVSLCCSALDSYTGKKSLQLCRRGLVTEFLSADENALSSVSGNASATGSASVSGDASASGNASASGDASVSGNADLPDLPTISVTRLAAALQEKIDAAEAEGLHLSFLMLDIRTGTILAYNSEQPFYSASSAKAHFIVSLADQKPEVITEWTDTIRSVTVDSSNENYKKLQELYSQDCYKDWLKRSGVSPEVEPDSGGYVFCSAEDLARLWLQDYLYFEENENGKTVGEWFETPNVSAIRTTADEDTPTRTKAGWIVGQDKDYTTSVDAGIIYEEDHPYILAMMSDYPADVARLEPYASLLEEIHHAMFSPADEASADDASADDAASEDAAAGDAASDDAASDDAASEDAASDDAAADDAAAEDAAADDSPEAGSESVSEDPAGRPAGSRASSSFRARRNLAMDPQ